MGGGDGTGPRAASADPTRVVCCVGDIHGFYDRLLRLWANLELRVGGAAFRTALVIFLGDYCDRGPQTREVIDFLLSLPSRYPEQRHVFLCGNHDLAFSAFVGALPPPHDGSTFSETWAEGGLRGDAPAGAAVGGVIRDRWNSKRGTEYLGSIYDAGPTFQSYGVPHGSIELTKAVPEEHKKFLSTLSGSMRRLSIWNRNPGSADEDDVGLDAPEGRLCCKLIAVHAGLERGKPVEQQLRTLRSRDTSISKVEALSGRQNVWNIPKELSGETPTIIVSGHHGKLHLEGLRFIVDEGGGRKESPVAALILPSQTIVRDTD
ncbi:unnamed protein product [Spirodela intermedia]|uniref:Calcineurin-like phosphoesterase domain-containing protein n=1 Tax=Spirodela intermedia TaxID=51605 RepID=A0A7I8JEC5_SPIIN|nr:unnamed protein product [Spirodela intermedia]CAA6668514.1 unnamed protein product [Spirodela intermedia]